jgi:hypothetical protein
MYDNYHYAEGNRIMNPNLSQKKKRVITKTRSSKNLTIILPLRNHRPPLLNRHNQLLRRKAPPENTSALRHAYPLQGLYNQVNPDYAVVNLSYCLSGEPQLY